MSSRLHVSNPRTSSSIRLRYEDPLRHNGPELAEVDGPTALVLLTAWASTTTTNGIGPFAWGSRSAASPNAGGTSSAAKAPATELASIAHHRLSRRTVHVETRSPRNRGSSRAFDSISCRPDSESHCSRKHGGADRLRPRTRSCECSGSGRIDPDGYEIEMIDTPFTGPRRMRFDSNGRLRTSNSNLSARQIEGGLQAIIRPDPDGAE